MSTTELSSPHLPFFHSLSSVGDRSFSYLGQDNYVTIDSSFSPPVDTQSIKKWCLLFLNNPKCSHFKTFTVWALTHALMASQIAVASCLLPSIPACHNISNRAAKVALSKFVTDILYPRLDPLFTQSCLQALDCSPVMSCYLSWPLSFLQGSQEMNT